jgi:murein DD-endopeptidase MepM/ murein hydrolase activator NlpD
MGIPLSTIRVSIVDMIALRVRTRREKDSPPPQCLYQHLPMHALSLLASLPRGPFAVSIPNQSKTTPGYAISEFPPPAAGGFMIVYFVQPNRRYEAGEILCQGKSYKILEFCEFAEKSLERESGSLKAIPHRFGYFAPTRDLWGAIQRDEGYTAMDAARLENGITPALLKNRHAQKDSGVIARIPVQTGDRQAHQTPLPAFARVEVTLDPNPGLNSPWLSYEEHKGIRSLQSQPPAAAIPIFRDWLRRFTAESGFESWSFHPGTLFGDPVEWWGEKNRRRTEHEGLDFAHGRHPIGRLCAIAEGTRVRAMAEGVVAAVLRDFLGQTVVINHRTIKNQAGCVFHTLYSHLQPKAGLLGQVVAKDEVLGQLGKSTSAGAPAHFHLAAAWIPQSIPPEELTLDHIHPGYAPIVLINLNPLVS